VELFNLSTAWQQVDSSGVISIVAWLLALSGFGSAAAFGWLWHRTAVQMRLREQLWQNALHALATRDYGGVQTLASMMNREPGKGLLGTQSSTQRATGPAPLDTHSNGDLETALRDTAAALKTSADEQERARRNLEDVLAALQDAVLVVDGEGHLRYLNNAALQLFGVRVEDVLGAALLEALPSFGLESAVRSALQEGISTSREVGLYWSPPSTQGDGANSGGLAGKREILLRVAPVRRGNGNVSGAVAILQDLTEMRRLERVRREFVANASHELRTPIANIRAGAETILSNPHDSALAARFLPHLVTESERLSRLVTDLLDLARAETSVETSYSPVDLSSVASGVVQRLKEKALANNVEVHCEFDESVRVSGDAAALEQVVFNLLDNALMYTPAKGHITLRLSFVESTTVGVDGMVLRMNGNGTSHDGMLHDGVSSGASFTGMDIDNARAALAPASSGVKTASRVTPPVHAAPVQRSALLSVSDTGIGIPPADQERVFERFYRVDKARSRTQGGTGLGLAIVKHIVENHGGHVTVRSEVGQGSTFSVTLPAL
jgi:two-component system phosphate regulon sensor histidine kinase PhoR